MSGEDHPKGEDRGASEDMILEQRVYEPDLGADLTTVVIEAVAAAEGVSITEVKEPPLYEVVDIAAIKEALFDAKATDTRGVNGGTLGFEYRGYHITVRGDGWVQVAKPIDP